MFSNMKTEYIAPFTDRRAKATLAKAAREGSSATIRLIHGQLRGDGNLRMTKGQATHVVKKIDEGVVELRFTKSN